MSENIKIKNINEAIKTAGLNQKKVIVDMDNETTIKTKDRTKFLAWQSFQSIIVNLETQKYILESIDDTDKITTLAV